MMTILRLLQLYPANDREFLCEHLISLPRSSYPQDAQTSLCLNYVQGGFCLIDGGLCLLGSRGNKARNQDHECPRHGSFDVWRTREDLILISDLEGPHESVKDCYGLRISLQEAARVGQKCARSPATKIMTTQRKCCRCGEAFWPRADLVVEGAPSRVGGYFCPSCVKRATQVGLQEYWKRIAGTQFATQIDLMEWCG